jgi:hypothetical protein
VRLLCGSPPLWRPYLPLPCPRCALSPPSSIIHHHGRLPYSYIPLLLCRCWLLMDNSWKHNLGYMLLSIASWQSANLSLTIWAQYSLPIHTSIAELRSYSSDRHYLHQTEPRAHSAYVILSSNFFSTSYSHPPLTLLLIWTDTRILLIHVIS